MRTIVLPLLILSGCASYEPPEPRPLRTGTQVSANFETTWNSVIDVFAGDNIPITTMDRASGFIAADRARVATTEALEIADCGSTRGPGGFVPYLATAAVYNVVVRESGAATTVRVTVTFTSPDRECVSLGTWEEAFERTVKTRAEAG